MQKIFSALLVAALLLAVIAAGCGSSSDGTPRTVTVVQKTVVQPPPPAEPATPSKTKQAKPKASAQPAGQVRVPDVVGKNHQYAQDTMQAAGLYNLAEEDATGQGRMLLWDRNWVVVEQLPAAGTMVNEDQTIVLRSKKQGE